MNKYERYRIQKYEEDIENICKEFTSNIEANDVWSLRGHLLKGEYLMSSIAQRLKRLRHGYKDYEWTVEAIHAERKKEHEDKNAVSDL